MHNHSSEFQTFAKSMHRNLSIIRMVPIVLFNAQEIIDFLKQGADTPEKRKAAKIWDLNWRHLLDAFSHEGDISPQSTYEELDRTLNEIIICRSVDAFLSYVPQILLTLFTQNQLAFLSFFEEAKKGGEPKKVSMRDILKSLIECDDKNEVIRQLAEAQVDDLAYKGIAPLIDHLNDRLKLKFDTAIPEYAPACELIEVRNIVVHNSSRVSKTFLIRTQRTDLQVGDIYPITSENASQMLINFKVFVDKLDNHFVTHFKLTPTATRYIAMYRYCFEAEQEG